MPPVEQSIATRYKSPAHAAARLASQELFLKPYTWSKVKVHVHGRQHLRGLQSPFIVVANHSSHLDTALIYGCLPGRLSRHLAVGAAADFFFSKWYKSIAPVMLFNSFPIERKKGGDQRRRGLAGRLLSADVPILVFPEGTRTRNGVLGQFNPGSAALSISRNAPVVPVAIVGAFAAWPHTSKTVMPGRPPVHVVFGTPMTALPGEIATEFSARLREVIVELHDSTARAYDMPTFDDYARASALREISGADNRVSSDQPAADSDKKEQP